MLVAMCSLSLVAASRGRLVKAHGLLAAVAHCRAQALGPGLW